MTRREPDRQPHRVTFITNFADQAVILPLILALAGVLAALGWPRGAASWLVVAGTTFGAMLALKIFAIACGPPGFQSPSGHTAAAALVAGGLTAVLTRHTRRSFVPVLFTAALAAAVIGLSRRALGFHTEAEVAVGGLVGCAGALALYLLMDAPPLRLRLRWVAAAVACALVLFHGLHLNAEPRIRHGALAAARELGVCRGAPVASSARALRPPADSATLPPASDPPRSER